MKKDSSSQQPDHARTKVSDTLVENPPAISYYAIIPADVRYSKIPAGAKLLYGEVTALCNTTGFCWASNSYFAEIYEKDVDTIRRWIKHLKDEGFIWTELESGVGRRIYIKKPSTYGEGKVGDSESGVSPNALGGSAVAEAGSEDSTPYVKDPATPYVKIRGGVRKNKGGPPAFLRGVINNNKINNKTNIKNPENPDQSCEAQLGFFLASPEEKEVHPVWSDFKNLLILQGNEEASAKSMIGKLIQRFGAERVTRIYKANEELIYEQADAYGYLTAILKTDKSLNKDEDELQAALKEARQYHSNIHMANEHPPPFRAEHYVERWPVLLRYVSEVMVGQRELPASDREALVKADKMKALLEEQARYFGRIQ